MPLAAASREVYNLIKGGIPVKYQTDQGEQQDRAQVVDWTAPLSNDFVAISEFTIAGEIENRRPDILGFVNGLPFLLLPR